MMTRAEIARYHTDGAVHATYWVAQLPRVPVHAAFLRPLLAETQMVRSVAVVMEPVALLAAPIAEQIYATIHDGQDCDLARHLAALAALPGSWERRRTQHTLKRDDPPGRHTARRRRHR